MEMDDNETAKLQVASSMVTVPTEKVIPDDSNPKMGLISVKVEPPDEIATELKEEPLDVIKRESGENVRNEDWSHEEPLIVIKQDPEESISNSDWSNISNADWSNISHSDWSNDVSVGSHPEGSQSGVFNKETVPEIPFYPACLAPMPFGLYNMPEMDISLVRWKWKVRRILRESASEDKGKKKQNSYSSRSRIGKSVKSRGEEQSIEVASDVSNSKDGVSEGIEPGNSSKTCYQNTAGDGSTNNGTDSNERTSTDLREASPVAARRRARHAEYMKKWRRDRNRPPTEEEEAEHRAALAEITRIERKRETEEQLRDRLAAHGELARIRKKAMMMRREEEGNASDRRSMETEDEAKARRALRAEKMRLHRRKQRANETEEEAAARRAAHAKLVRVRSQILKMNETPEQSAERKAKRAERMRRLRLEKRERETEEEAKARRAAHARAMRIRNGMKRANETAEEAAARRAAHSELMRVRNVDRRGKETEDEAKARKARHAEKMRQRRKKQREERETER